MKTVLALLSFINDSEMLPTALLVHTQDDFLTNSLALLQLDNGSVY